MSYRSNRFNMPSQKPNVAAGKTCYGKFAGFLLGALFGGFWGAIIGLAAGHILIDASGLFNPKIPPATMPHKETPKSGKSDVYRQKFIRIWCGMAAKMAKADGVITQEEIAIVEQFMDTVLQLDTMNREFAISAFRLAKDSTYPFEHYAKDFVSLTENDLSINRSVLDMLVRLAVADGSVNAEERDVLKQAADIFGIPLREFDSILKTHSGDFRQYYAVLDCKEGDTEEVIKERYRTLIKENHPDVILGKGMPEEFVNYATKRFNEIQQAYEAISGKRGFT